MNNFFKRAVALIIDLFFLSFVCNVFSLVTVRSDTLLSIEQEFISIQENFEKEKIDDEAYINQAVDVFYDMFQSLGLYMVVSIGVYLFYFGYFQYKKNGQTIGKRIMKIRVQGKNRDLTINDFVYRSFIANGILFQFIIVLLLFFGSKQMFMWLYFLITLVSYIIMVLCGLMVLFRKDHRGFHDFIGHSEVVNE